MYRAILEYNELVKKSNSATTELINIAQVEEALAHVRDANIGANDR